MLHVLAPRPGAAPPCPGLILVAVKCLDGDAAPAGSWASEATGPKKAPAGGVPRAGGRGVTSGSIGPQLQGGSASLSPRDGQAVGTGGVHIGGGQEKAAGYGGAEGREGEGGIKH